MWTTKNRRRYDRSRLRYPSDLTDDEWGHVELLIPANLRKDAARPNTLRTLFNIKTGSFDKQQWDIKIRDDDDKPRWLVHPSRASMLLYCPFPSNRKT
jgi:hypothetical protein